MAFINLNDLFFACHQADLDPIDVTSAEGNFGKLEVESGVDGSDMFATVTHRGSVTIQNGEDVYAYAGFGKGGVGNGAPVLAKEKFNTIEEIVAYLVDTDENWDELYGDDDWEDELD
jgi:hypothetical protein